MHQQDKDVTRAGAECKVGKISKVVAAGEREKNAR